MYYQEFLDHIALNGCIQLPEFSSQTEAIFRDIYTGQEASLTPDTWISYVHAIAFCRDMDIDIPAQLLEKEAAFDALGLF